MLFSLQKKSINLLTFVMCEHYKNFLLITLSAFSARSSESSWQQLKVTVMTAHCVFRMYEVSIANGAKVLKLHFKSDYSKLKKRPAAVKQ